MFHTFLIFRQYLTLPDFLIFHFCKYFCIAVPLLTCLNELASMTAVPLYLPVKLVLRMIASRGTKSIVIIIVFGGLLICIFSAIAVAVVIRILPS